MDLLTTQEAAKILRVTPQTVSAYCANGKLEGAVKFSPGAPWRIPSTAIDALLAPAPIPDGDYIPPRSTRSKAQRAAAERRRQRRQ
jgi:excisionase family DNA binding protein